VAADLAAALALLIVDGILCSRLVSSDAPWTVGH
jgi:hypothetical protein